MIKSSSKLSALFIGGDMLTLIITFLASVYFFNDYKHHEAEWIMFIGLIIIWFLIGYSSKLYDLELHHGFTTRMISYIKAYVFLILLVFLFYSLFPLAMPPRNVMLATIMGLPVLGIPVNYLLTNSINELRNSLKNKKYTLVAGIGNTANNVVNHLHSNNSGRHIRGFIKCKNEVCVVEQDQVVGDLDSINLYLKENPVDEIIIAIPVKASKKVKNILTAADYHGVRVKYVPDFEMLFGKNYKITRDGNIVAVNVRQLPLDETSAFYIKNSFDKLFATVALIMLAPIFLLIAILIKLDSPGPVFYCPIRIGKGGRPFRVYKFRSMRTNDAPSGGTLSTQQNDPRITKLGKILRKYSLDELPQFLNVLLGNMSVVGPRPHRSYLNQQLQESVDKYMIRHYFKPGITGWAQVNGWRGPTDTQEQRSQRTQHDIWYMENWSLLLDIKIILHTLYSRKVHKSAF